MSDVVVEVRDLAKLYRLGKVGTGTLSQDLNRWWASIRGKEDPYSKIGQRNRRDQRAKSDFVWALKDINFDVRRGDILGIIAANGAGKSTLLKLISRITSPTTGRIRAKGRIASLLEVGTGMHPEMTARENIYLNGALLGMRRSEISRKFADIVDFAGCEMYVDTPVKRYSSGMRVRLGFAVAAFLEPEILIVDEVLAVGDASFQKKAIGKMQEVSQGEGRTVLFVSHNMAAVHSLCTRCLVMDAGTVIYDGETNAAINTYLTTTYQSPGESLLNHEERTGSGAAQITNARLLNDDLQDSTCTWMGDAWQIEVTCQSQQVIKNTTLNLIVTSPQGTRIARVRSVDLLGEGFEFTGTVRVLFSLKEVNLLPGTYAITLTLASGSDVLDEIPHGLQIEVMPRDVHNSGSVGVDPRSICFFRADATVEQ